MANLLCLSLELNAAITYLVKGSFFWTIVRTEQIYTVSTFKGEILILFLQGVVLGVGVFIAKIPFLLFRATARPGYIPTEDSNSCNHINVFMLPAGRSGIACRQNTGPASSLVIKALGRLFLRPVHSLPQIPLYWR